MNAYGYDREGFYVGPVPRQQSPLEPGVWLLPAQSTEVAPPAIPGGFRAKFNFTTENWDILEIPATPTDPTQTPTPQPDPQPTPTP